MSPINGTMEGTLFIDMMSPRGHVRLNNFYLSKLGGPAARIYISDDLANDYEDYDTRSLGPKPCGTGKAERLALTLRVLAAVRREAPKRVMLLSYDLATFPLLSQTLRALRMPVSCFEHNTGPTSTARQLFHRLSDPHATRFVYTPYLEHAYLRLGLNAVYTPHPCLRWGVGQAGGSEWKQIVAAQSGDFNAVGLCPSGSVTIDQMEQIARAYPKFLFVFKSRRTSCLPNVITHPYFDDYGDALHQCDFIVVPFSSGHKVSGPVYEAMAMNKPAMVLNNLFGNYLKSLFPGCVFFPDEPLPSQSNLSKLQIERNNRQAIARVTNALVRI